MIIPPDENSFTIWIPLDLLGRRIFGTWLNNGFDRICIQITAVFQS